MQNLIEEILFSNIIDEAAVFLIFLLVSFSFNSNAQNNYQIKRATSVYFKFIA